MNEQRAAVPFLPGLTRSKQPEILQRLSVATSKDDQFPDESFFEMLMKCQGSRIEEQRSSLPNNGGGGGHVGAGAEAEPDMDGGHGRHPGGLDAPTVPDEDFFSLIQRFQAGRLEDQRASLDIPKTSM
jgi:G-protein signaling modulator 2